MNLWLDDVRLPPSNEWVWVKTAKDALWRVSNDANRSDLGEDPDELPLL